MRNTISYYITNEIRVRLKTSLLLWCYFGSVLVICIPNALTVVFFHQLMSYHNLPSMLLFIFLVFFPINLDVFARESQLHMLDYLVMNSVRFHTIYTSRIMANAVLMVIPIILGFLSIVIVQVVFIDPLLIPLSLVYLLIISLFFFCWFSIAVLSLSIVELKFPDSMLRVILYFGGLIIIIGFLLFINKLSKPSHVIIGIILGQQLFENLFLSFIEIIIICVVTILLLSLVLTRRINFIIRRILTIGQELEKEKFPLKFDFYSFLEALRSIEGSSWQRRLPYLGVVPYLLLFIIISDRPRLMVSFMQLLGYHFFFILMYALLMVFPRMTIEKEFNMEELLLSRITTHRYFFEKVTLLFRSIFIPFMIATVAITILSWPSVFYEVLIFIIVIITGNVYVSILNFIWPLLFIILIVRAFYFVSVIIFIWRLFPSKDLLQSTLFSIIGLEVLGFLVIGFIVPLDIVLESPISLIYSPILSSLLISDIMIGLYVENYINLIFFSIWMNFAIATALFLGSLILIKSEVRFE